jgi:hypothetical protein
MLSVSLSGGGRSTTDDEVKEAAFPNHRDRNSKTEETILAALAPIDRRSPSRTSINSFGCSTLVQTSTR